MFKSGPFFRDDTIFGVCEALGEDFGFAISTAASTLVVSVEETLELALPLIVVVAAVQYALARR